MVEGYKRFYAVGEKREIAFKIIPNSSNDVLIITAAKYEILKDDKIIKSGNASVIDDIVSIIFDADEAGSFTVRFFVTVPPETIEAELSAVVKSR